MLNIQDYFNIKNFKKLKEIGNSPFSSVFIVQEKRTKKIYTARILRNELSLDAQEFKDLTRDTSILSKLSHKAILRVYGISPIDFNNENRPVIFTQYVKNGSLDKIIDQEKAHKAPVEWTFTKKLINIFGIASAMQYLHSHQILHRNLKPSNILESDNFYPKISDFGLSKVMESIVAENFPVGASFFMAPEWLNSGGNVFSQSSDVFSFALTVYNLITGDSPCLNKNNNVFLHYANLDKGERPQFKKQVPESYVKLITDCWSMNPSDRPSFEEIVSRLKTDRGFITSEVDLDEYLEYIRNIESIEDKEKEEEDKIEQKSDNSSDFEDNYEHNHDEDEEEEEEEEEKKPLSIDVKNLNLQNFEKQDKIGQGYSSDVYKIRSKSTNVIYAAKILKDEMFEEKRDTKTAENLLREVSILSELSHPSIMKFYGYSGTDFIKLCRPVIITEYLGNGSLEELTEMERNGFQISFINDTLKLIMIYGIAKSMSYLHSKNIVHRDLKLYNVLTDEYLFPKLADFGFSKHLNNQHEYKEKNDKQIYSGVMGTSAFIAPEIWKNATYSKPGDVYAFGILVYEMITLEAPFLGMNNYQVSYHVVNKKQRPKFKKQIPSNYKELIEECWSQEPSKRPTFDQILTKLETDPRFTTNIDKKFFNDYINFIKEQEQKNSIKNNRYSFQKYSLEEMNKEIKENKSELIGEGFLNIESYFGKSEIYRNDFSCFCDVTEKVTGKLYSAEISNINVNNLNVKEKQKLTSEVGILTKLNHPTIQRFIGYSLFDFEHQPNPVIIREHTSQETLYGLLSKERNGNKNEKWTSTKKLINIYGIASGMSYLHSKDVIHHELNTRNIFVDSELNPKITEFGFMIKPQNSSRISSHSTVNNHIKNGKEIPYYLSPEIIQYNENEIEGEGENNIECEKASDVYSFAFVVYEVITNKIPFSNVKDQNQLFKEVINKMSRPSLDGVPLKYKELISVCWSGDPKERPTFDKIVRILGTDKEFNEEINSDEYHNYINTIVQSI